VGGAHDARCKKIGHDDGRFRFVFEAADGRRAEVEIEDTEGLVRTTRTRLLAARES
jgi:hypothetical protein